MLKAWCLDWCELVWVSVNCPCIGDMGCQVCISHGNMNFSEMPPRGVNSSYIGIRALHRSLLGDWNIRSFWIVLFVSHIFQSDSMITITGDEGLLVADESVNARSVHRNSWTKPITSPIWPRFATIFWKSNSFCLQLQEDRTIGSHHLRYKAPL